MRVIISDVKRIIYEGAAKEVVLPGYDGEISVLDFHQPFLCALRAGNIRILNKWEKQEAEEKSESQTCVFLKYGIARMMGNELKVTVESHK